MTLVAAIKNVIYDWFSAASGLTTIWAEQSGPRPDAPYATLKIITGPQVVGLADEMRTHERIVSLEGIRRFTLSCQGYGAGTFDALKRVQDNLQKLSLQIPCPLEQAQVRVVKIVTATVGATYVFTLEGEDFGHVALAGTLPELRDELVTFLNDFSDYEAGVLTDDDLLLIRGEPGLEFALTTDAKMTVVADAPETVEAVSLSVLQDLGLRDITGLLDTTWEDRSGLDIYFLSANRIDTDASTIEAVEGEENLSTDGESVTITETLLVEDN